MKREARINIVEIYDRIEWIDEILSQAKSTFEEYKKYFQKFEDDITNQMKDLKDKSEGEQFKAYLTNLVSEYSEYGVEQVIDIEGLLNRGVRSYYTIPYKNTNIEESDINKDKIKEFIDKLKIYKRDLELKLKELGTLWNHILTATRQPPLEIVINKLERNKEYYLKYIKNIENSSQLEPPKDNLSKLLYDSCLTSLNKIREHIITKVSESVENNISKEDLLSLYEIAKKILYFHLSKIREGSINGNKEFYTKYHNLLQKLESPGDNITTSLEHNSDRIKTIYNGLNGNLDRLDKFAKDELLSILNLDNENQSKFTLLNVFYNKFKSMMSALYDDGKSIKISFKKISSLAKMLGDKIGISENQFKKIIGQLIKGGYNYLISSSFSEIIGKSKKEAIEAARIIFENVFRKKITSANDYITFYQIYEEMKNIEKSRIEEILYYFENLKSKNKIKQSDFIKNFKKQIERYDDLRLIFHNNYSEDSYEYYEDRVSEEESEFEGTIIYDIFQNLFKLAGSKKYSEELKNVVNSLTTIMGFYSGKHKNAEEPIKDIDEEVKVLIRKVWSELSNLIDSLDEKNKKILVRAITRILNTPQSASNARWTVRVLHNKDIQNILTPEIKSLRDTIASYMNIKTDSYSFILNRAYELIDKINESDDKFIKIAGFESKEQAEDAIINLAKSYKNLYNLSFSNIKYLSNIGNRIMYLTNVYSVNNGYKNLIGDVESLEDVESTTGIKMDYNEKDKKHPALYKLNFDLGNGYHFKTFEPLDPRHLTIGIETDCCQRLGGEGEEAAIDSFINPLAGVVILEGPEGLITQSYFHYVPQENGYILDNIEGFPEKIGVDKVKNMYMRLADHIKKNGGKYLEIGKEYSTLNFDDISKSNKREDDPRYFAVDDPYTDFDIDDYWELTGADPNNIESKNEFENKPFANLFRSK